MRSRWTANNLQVSGSPGSERASIQETDESLAARVSTDPEAFAELYRRFFHRIYNFCLRRLHSTEAAEDATSQIFVKALEGLRQSQVRQVTPWLFTIAYREVANRYRTRRAELPIDDLRLAGLTGPEIRTVPGKSRSWVDVTQHRAVKRLRHLMHPGNSPEGPEQ